MKSAQPKLKWGRRQPERARSLTVRGRTVASVLMVAAAVFSAACSQGDLSRPLAVEEGNEVGQRLPSFEARDQHGQLQSLETLNGSNGLYLLVHRSADW